MIEPKVSFLIVGQGLAGTLAGHFLEKHGYSFSIMDEPHEMTSSKVAAGMFNPVNGKRMVKNWNAELVIPFAINTYKDIEQKLSTSILHQLPIHHVLGSVKEQNDLTLKTDNTDFMQFIEMDAPKIKFVKEPWGSFQISQSGWVNTPLLLSKYAQYWLNSGKLNQETMDYSLLMQQDDGTWKYKDLHAENILFCEGHRYHLNPFFTHIPYEPTKGDVLTIKCVGLPHDKIIKKGIYLVHLGNDFFKVGATYDRVNIHNNPDPKAREEIIKDLIDLIDKPFEVIKHEAGIRPTMRDRNPLAQAHPEIKNMYILNGLGSKGVMLGPWFANKLISVISETNK
jgi:glycine/D-amino acid oxidase-like deaminating enzyme